MLVHQQHPSAKRPAPGALSGRNRKGGSWAAIQGSHGQHNPQQSQSVRRDTTTNDTDWSGELIDNKYEIAGRIGGGSFSDCYVGKEVRTGAPVCFKLEDPSKIRGGSRLRTEYDIIATLCSKVRDIRDRRLPQALHYASLGGGCSVMVMELMGPSLGDLLKMCGGRFSINTTCLIAIQILEALKFVHSHGYVHRDIKPQNFLVGRGVDMDRIFICDFGLSKPYNTSGVPKTGGKPAGTIRYVSLNAHRGVEQSRRDDLEALGYMLVHFITSKLPWNNIHTPENASKKYRHHRIHEYKETRTTAEVCVGCPPAIEQYLRTCRNMDFLDTPDYRGLQRMFERLRQQTGQPEVFDWKQKSLYNGGDQAMSPTKQLYVSDNSSSSSSTYFGNGAAYTPRLGAGSGRRRSSSPSPVYGRRYSSPQPPSSTTTTTTTTASPLSPRGRNGPYPVGANVEGLFAGVYHAAVIYRVLKDGSYVLHWKDGTYTHGVLHSDIRPVASQPSFGSYRNSSSHRRASSSHRHNSSFQLKNSGGDTLYNKPASGSYVPGSPVMAIYRGQSFPAKIHSRGPDGTYTVCWDDGTYSTGVYEEHISRRR
eukprot:TRINITY_DN9891_c0_g2_i1.p1 TRINITY_DN9891_c0_g2~~TRINITY_DN9891_c0_g2_i1.p1  ORF type:complete len:591 (+),score=63.26 TRINITY_DN9891_c0_g2_i1:45-1817(+)